MAKIEFHRETFGSTQEDDSPPSVESLEILVWGSGGTATQEFVIGSGGNFNASTNFWIEVRYSVQGLPVFYTRNIVSHAWGDVCEGQLARLEEFSKGKEEVFAFGDMLPETSLSLERKTYTYDDGEGQEHTYVDCGLNIHLDFGAIFGHSGPGERLVEILFPNIELEEGLGFMRELIAGLEAACQGRHPDPGLLPPGFSQWPFVRELNRRSYDKISETYDEDYFEEDPLLKDAFDNWISKLPESAHVLDAGCGHGDPVITHLLERGLRVTGSDLSPVMLGRARAKFPQVEFWEKDTTELEAEAEFDGVCSFSSMIYLDPIDFFHSIYRIYRALKPGGSLFLYGYDLHPGWRGRPYQLTLGHWMWDYTRGLEETTRALEEHGYFKVAKTVMTESEEALQKRIAEWREEKQKEHDEWLASLGPDTNIEHTDYSTATPKLLYPYLVIAQKQER
jgi:SAM-dependent methyltransferase